MSGLSINDLKVHFGGIRALDGVDLTFGSSGIHALIGPNGAGKTTLVNAVTGVYAPTAGRVLFDGHDITGLPAHKLATLGVTRTFQNLQIFWTMSVLENVLAGFHLDSSAGFLRGLLRGPALVRRERELTTAALGLLRLVNLEAKANNPADALAYGELKRLEIARALAGRPKLLFLDEPVAGCTQSEKCDLAEVIRNAARESAVSVVLIEHDMRLVMAVSDRVTVLAQGRILSTGTPSEVRADPKVITAYLGTTQSHLAEQVHAVAG
ncbi:hypothetical protein AC629_21430 [Bradyrhizobium sp. NAS80.1]|uniref:ABC transporter ATP-binding protein n=1 Tax=Bradyrhizobium sp. NAS80.1 TaxID=1680159 RepID=UPI000966C872|nr:ABC transporter ATP-binding protein [Bradyrhizobium sp. NAS80.1]OKO84424.1 hypothetical protein AC629_21430 [Bradyrhizobium sp. NAS80.1]